MLSVFPAALIAGWLGLVRRSNAGSASIERPTPAAATEKPVPTYSYSTEFRDAEGPACATEPVRTMAVHEAQGRLFQYIVFSSRDRTEVYTYDVPDPQA